AKGATSEMRHFGAFQEAFSAFFEGEKALDWTDDGLLVVKILATGEEHDLSSLSDGEKQMILLVADLLRHWRPGSMVIIDEPELHLHDQWQTRLWLLLERLRRERGGQVIVATQSRALWGLGEPGTKVLLDRPRHP